MAKPEVFGHAISIPGYGIFDLSVDHDERAVDVAKMWTISSFKWETKTTEIIAYSGDFAHCQE